MRKLLLDTGIVLGYATRAGYAEYVEKKFDIFANTPLVSVVTKGEIYSLSIQRNWGANKLKLLDELLRKLPVVDINDDQIIRRYAEIDAYSLGEEFGGASSKGSDRSTDGKERSVDRCHRFGVKSNVTHNRPRL